MRLKSTEKHDLKMAILEAIENVDALIDAHKNPYKSGYIDEELVKDRQAQIVRWQRLIKKMT